MSQVADVVREVLTPLVGGPAATMCIHAAASSLGKQADALTRADLPAVAERIRTDMRPFTSPELLDAAIENIKTLVG
ncbi:MAG: hypothetical protein Q7W51_00215 [Coriobacteriia bacterium]|nr:hypothetical protein [Coriobacteriia bacterium]